MIAEKPSWVRHEGMQIFSIDVQPGGLRFATGGGDHKVRNFTIFKAQLWKILKFGYSVIWYSGKLFPILILRSLNLSILQFLNIRFFL